MAERDVGAARTSGMLLVAGRYRLVELIGTGGMGRVWRGHDEVLDRPVAVKEVMPPTGLTAADRRTVALQTLVEARAAARLSHPGVVQVYDAVRTTGRSWIVMEYVESDSAHARLTRDGPLPHAEAARIGLAVVAALRAAHSAGVLHRDIKPHNILLAADGRVLLTDFGLASLDSGRSDNDLPLIASPNYVAPERLRDRVSSVESDLWSLGATLFTMVEGAPPFHRADANESLLAILEKPPNRAKHPGRLHPLIDRLLAKDPAQRPSADDVRATLHAVANRTSVFSAGKAPVSKPPVSEPPISEPPISEPPTPALPVPAPPRPRRRRRRLIGALVAMLVAAAPIVAWNLRPDDDSARATSRTAATPVAAATATPSECAGAQPQTGSAPAGFEIEVPAGWSRARAGDVTCFSAPGGARTVSVRPVAASKDGPLRRWETAERSTDLPDYRKVSMGVLLVTGGGADWEYSWQPATGPRLHTHRYLLWAAGPRAYEISWTTFDRDWTAATAAERTIVRSLRDRANTAPTWAVPQPQ